MKNSLPAAEESVCKVREREKKNCENYVCACLCVYIRVCVREREGGRETGYVHITFNLFVKNTLFFNNRCLVF